MFYIFSIFPIHNATSSGIPIKKINTYLTKATGPSKTVKNVRINTSDAVTSSYFFSAIKYPKITNAQTKYHPGLNIKNINGLFCIGLQILEL